jgi:predicted metallopeptidase
METIMNKPKNANELMVIVNKNIDVFIDRSSPVQDKPATKKMIDKNMRYIAKHTGLEKLWSTPEGQESILHAFGESLEHAATMPEMGSIVPFGNSAEFVPSVECYKFALENGNNAPLEDINIVLVHENDKTLVSQDDGVFNVKIDYGIPRGDIIAVCVYATRKDTGKRIGEVYDTDRLLEKAFAHSPGYRSYVIEKEQFKKLEVEGKLKVDKHGECYMEKTMYKKGGGTWTKNIYRRDLQNPYDGPDRPEMLKKAAGKSFFRPFMKTRNAMAMADEWSNDDTIQDEMTMEKAADDVLDKAAGQFDNVVDAEIVVEKRQSPGPTTEVVNNYKNDDLENNL